MGAYSSLKFPLLHANYGPNTRTSMRPCSFLATETILWTHLNSKRLPQIGGICNGRKSSLNTRNRDCSDDCSGGEAGFCGGRGGGGSDNCSGGGTGNGDVEDNEEEERWEWRWWWWSCSSIISYYLFRIVNNLLVGAQIDGELLERMVRGIVQPLVALIFEAAVVKMLSALPPLLVMSAIQAIAVALLRFWLAPDTIVSPPVAVVQFLMLVGFVMAAKYFLYFLLVLLATVFCCHQLLRLNIGSVRNR